LGLWPTIDGDQFNVAQPLALKYIGTEFHYEIAIRILCDSSGVRLKGLANRRAATVSLKKVAQERGELRTHVISSARVMHGVIHLGNKVDGVISWSHHPATVNGP
jgi:hypothetical protein